jgi:hypothetical protein
VEARTRPRRELTPVTIRVERLDGELLVLDGLALARAFFAGDANSPDDNALAGLGDPQRIELDDVLEMNRTMRSRSPHRVWGEILAAETPWLAAIPTDLDLIGSGDRAWRAADGDDLVAAALAATIGPGRGMGVATKLLHLKRPRLFPMLDRFVAELLGAAPAEAPAARVDTALGLMRLLRVEGRKNLGPLRAVQDELAANGTTQSLVRILDAILWLAHPAAGVQGARRTIDVRVRDD